MTKLVTSMISFQWTYQQYAYNSKTLDILKTEQHNDCQEPINKIQKQGLPRRYDKVGNID